MIRLLRRCVRKLTKRIIKMSLESLLLVEEHLTSMLALVSERKRTIAQWYSSLPVSQGNTEASSTNNNQKGGSY